MKWSQEHIYSGFGVLAYKKYKFTKKHNNIKNQSITGDEVLRILEHRRRLGQICPNNKNWVDNGDKENKKEDDGNK